MPFKMMQRKEVTHSNGSYMRKSRGRKLADEMGRAKKFPWYTHRLMHRKRMTSELHDSYFRLMTIKHSISKIECASNDYTIRTELSCCQLEFRCELSCSHLEFESQWQLRPVELETRCGKESHIRPKGLKALMSWGPEKMLIRCSKESQHPAEWTPRLRLSIREKRKTQR